MDSDCKYWDMSVRLWMLLWEVDLRAVLQTGLTSVWHRAAINVALVLSLSLICLSDGSLWVAARPGIQKSGVKTTSSGNSHIRKGVDCLVGVEWSLVASDDDVCARVPDYTEKLAKYGVTVKVENHFEVGGAFEFCSTIMGEGIAQPLNVEKMVGHLLTSAPDTLLYMQFQYEIRNSPRRLEWLKLVEESGWSKGLSPLPLAVALLLRENDQIKDSKGQSGGHEERERSDDFNITGRAPEAPKGGENR
jgi:hypothetical protein